jgi:histidyl-tRNA synthetase
MGQKPSLPKGTRDFNPTEMAGRNHIFETIKKVFREHGYTPIETPAMEHLSTLLGKYGEEGDRLIFKILNSGNFLAGIGKEDHEDLSVMSARISEKGLRYDLTVPFARFVVQNQHQIVFPFKRYQIQPVWRADRPQKGRYREFYQCDVDVIGSDSLLNEIELLQIIDRVFTILDINTVSKVNNRKILTGIAEMIGKAEKITDITIAIDKLEKTGFDKVREELLLRGLSAEDVDRLAPVLSLEGTSKEKLSSLRTILKNSKTGIRGIEEMEEVFGLLDSLNFQQPIELDLSLARGLNYYTGVIIEVKSREVEIGSICGGGRYDNLTGVFGLKGVSGVGVSFGADRIYDVMEKLTLFPEGILASSDVLFVNFGKKEQLYNLNLMQHLRESGVSCELYPDESKVKKQLSYASQKNIKWVVLAGEEEMRTFTVTVRNMQSGQQVSMPHDRLLSFLTETTQ